MTSSSAQGRDSSLRCGTGPLLVGAGRGEWTDGGGDARGGDGSGVDGVTARVGPRGRRQGGHAGDPKPWTPKDITVYIRRALTAGRAQFILECIGKLVSLTFLLSHYELFFLG